MSDLGPVTIKNDIGPFFTNNNLDVHQLLGSNILQRLHICEMLQNQSFLRGTNIRAEVIEPNEG